MIVLGLIVACWGGAESFSDSDPRTAGPEQDELAAAESTTVGVFLSPETAGSRSGGRGRATSLWCPTDRSTKARPRVSCRC